MKNYNKYMMNIINKLNEEYFKVPPKEDETQLKDYDELLKNHHELTEKFNELSAEYHNLQNKIVQNKH